MRQASLGPLHDISGTQGDPALNGPIVANTFIE